MTIAPHDSPSAPPGVNFGSEAQFLRSVLASSGDCIKVLDLDGNLLFMNEEGKKLMEVSDFNAIGGCPWPDFWREGLNEEARAAVQCARGGGEGRFEGMSPTLLGKPKWWDVRVTAIRNVNGKPQNILVVSREITIQKEAQAQQRLLMGELAHRVKNILAVVQAIALMSFRNETDLSQARDTFHARLMALAQAQDALIWNAQEAHVAISNLLAKIVILHGNPSQFELNGPDIVLGSKFALKLSLVLHELFTNALKYGALIGGKGVVAISWHLSGSDHDQYLELLWVESGGPLVTKPTRRGFGSRLIAESLATGPTSSTKITYEPHGVRFHLKTSLGEVQDGAPALDADAVAG